MAIAIVNEELVNLNVWLIANRLSLNIDKTKYILFSTTDRINCLSTVKLENQVIEKVNHASFLGIILDSNLRWHRHISQIRSKISRSLGIFMKINKIFPPKIIRSLYFTLVYPHLIYCIEVWGGAAQTHLLPLYRIQKKIVRIMTSSGYREHTADLFIQLELLNVNQLYIYHVLFFMYKFIRNSLPPVFNNFFLFTPTPHYALRQSPPLVVPFFRLTVSRRSVSYSGPSLLNKYYERLDFLSGPKMFKSNLKTLALQNIL